MRNFVVIDAGPSLTFYAAGMQELLHASMDAISHELLVPEIIKSEILDKSLRSPHDFGEVPKRFEGDGIAGRFRVIGDKRGASMARIIRKVQLRIRKFKKDGDGNPIPPDAPLTAEDLGEATVIAHAQLLEHQNYKVYVLIDEWRGTKVAMSYGLSVIDSVTILRKAAKLGLIPDQGEMRRIWEKFRLLDLSHSSWRDTPRLHDRSMYGTEKPD